MSQPLDFSNQDLRNRSFIEQDLSGADFCNSDIRGCCFFDVNLEGANFSRVIAGKSISSTFIAVLGAFLAIVVGAFVGEFLFVIVLSSLFEVANILKVLSINTLKHLSLYVESDSEKLARIVATAERIYTEKDLWLTPLKIIGATISTFISIRLHLGSAFFGGSTLFAGKNAVARAIQELGDGDKALGIVYLGIAFCLLYPAYTFFIEAVEKILNMTATSFEGSELTNAKFVGAILKNCDFTDAKLYQIDWTHAHFNRCKFSSYLSNQLVRELCVTRIGTNQDFSYIDLSDLNLIGVDLRGANLNASNLNRTNLMQADLQNTNLHKTQAIKTDFTNANLSGACIENWAITTETIFTDVVCSHIFLDTTKNERKPSSGYFEKDDFEKLVTQSTKSLDFFFRNGIDPQAFDFALNNLIDNYHEMGISLKSVEDFGDGDRIVRFNTVSDAPKAEMHAQFTQDYEEIHQQLEASRNKIWELQQKLDRIDLENLKVRYELEKQLAVAIAKLEERPTSKDLQNLLYHQVSELGKQKLIYANNSTINMIDKSIQSGGDVFFTGRDNVGVSGKDLQGVAGRDISGTVTNTIQQLRETNQPEAPQLSDLLEQLQKAVESSDELDKPEKEKALDYLNKIVEMSVKEPAQKKGMLPILLDAFTGVISKAANLIDPVKKIAAAILSIWQA